MFSPKLLDHFRNPRLAGDLDGATRTVEVSNPACGDTLRLAARIEAGIVVDARFRVRGCTASIGTAAAMTEWMLGKEITALTRTTAAGLESLVDGLPSESKHAAILCLDALRSICG